MGDLATSLKSKAHKAKKATALQAKKDAAAHGTSNRPTGSKGAGAYKKSGSPSQPGEVTGNV